MQPLNDTAAIRGHRQPQQPPSRIQQPDNAEKFYDLDLGQIKREDSHQGFARPASASVIASNRRVLTGVNEKEALVELAYPSVSHGKVLVVFPFPTTQW